MQEIYTENIGEVLRNKKRLEKELKVKIENKGRDVFIEGDGEKEYIATKVIEALNLGFSIEKALLLKNENSMMQILSIKELTKRKDLHEIKARIIGTHGKTLSTISNLSDCHISLHNNQVAVIGETECIEEAIGALICLIQGSKHGNVYARLEKEKKQRRINQKLNLNENIKQK